MSVGAGYVWDMIPHEFPVVLGRDLVGTVAAVGEGVDSISVGAPVAGVIPGMALSARNGSFAEYVTLPGSAVTAVPPGVDAPQAAVIGLAGVADHDALDALEALNIQPGDVVHMVLHATALGTNLQAGGRIAPEAFAAFADGTLGKVLIAR